MFEPDSNTMAGTLKATGIRACYCLLCPHYEISSTNSQSLETPQKRSLNSLALVRVCLSDLSYNKQVLRETKKFLKLVNLVL